MPQNQNKNSLFDSGSTTLVSCSQVTHRLSAIDKSALARYHTPTPTHTYTHTNSLTSSGQKTNQTNRLAKMARVHSPVHTHAVLLFFIIYTSQWKNHLVSSAAWCRTKRLMFLPSCAFFVCLNAKTSSVCVCGGGGFSAKCINRNRSRRLDVKARKQILRK